MPNFATAQEVADRLELPRAHAVYCGEMGTHCLRRLEFGKRAIRFYWPQVEAHLRLMLLKGQCDGTCVEVFDHVDQAIEADRRLRLVPDADAANAIAG
jgi:hypothetical protein